MLLFHFFFMVFIVSLICSHPLEAKNFTSIVFFTSADNILCYNFATNLYVNPNILHTDLFILKLYVNLL